MYGNHNTNSDIGSPQKNNRIVYFYGSSAATIPEGYAVCYTPTATGTGRTAADKPNGKRDSAVVLPDNTNNLYFAGVASHNAIVRGQKYAPLNIDMPGGCTFVYLNEANATLGKLATFIVGGNDAGKWTTSVDTTGGRGCVRLLQTNTAPGLVLAKLLDGEESGGAEFVQPDPAGGEIEIMNGGITVFNEAVDLAAAATFTMASPKSEGMRKRFACKAEMTTNDIVVTVTNGIQADGATVLNTISFDADGEVAVLESVGGYWKEVVHIGAAIA